MSDPSEQQAAGASGLPGTEAAVSTQDSPVISAWQRLRRDGATRRRLTVAAMVVIAGAVVAADLMDLKSRPQDTLPAVHYALPVLIAAYFLGPRAVAIAATAALTANLLVAWNHWAPFWITGIEIMELAVIGLLSVMLSSKIRQETALKSEAELGYLKLRAVVDGMIEGVVVLNQQGRVQSANVPAAIIHGRENPCEMEGRPFSDLAATLRMLTNDGQVIAPDQWPSARVLRGETLSNWDALLSPAEPAGTLVARYNGRLVHSKTGNGALGILTVQDITKERRDSEALRESEERFRLITLNSPDIIFHQDRDLRYTWLTNLAPPYTRDQMLGKTDTDLLPLPEAQVMTDIKRRVLNTGVGARAEMCLTNGGTTRCYDLAIEPWRDRKGQIVGLIGYGRDITEHRSTEAQLREQQRAAAILKERGRLARELHDSLGNVLGYVVTESQAALQLMSQGDTQTARDFLGRVVIAAKDAVLDIREFVTGVKAASTPAGLLTAVAEHLHRLEDSYGINTELTVQPGFDENTIRDGPRIQLLRIIQEALTNVRKHSGASRVKVSFSLQMGQAEVEVEDDGRGFDPTRATNGSPGFGLVVMRERAEELGGSLEASSSPGAGTKILVRIPVS